MSMSSASLERRLRALEVERSSRHPERLLVLLGISEVDTAAQFAQLVRDRRADSAEPYQSIDHVTIRVRHFAVFAVVCHRCEPPSW